MIIASTKRIAFSWSSVRSEEGLSLPLDQSKRFCFPKEGTTHVQSSFPRNSETWAAETPFSGVEQF